MNQVHWKPVWMLGAFWLYALLQPQANAGGSEDQASAGHGHRG
jgi:hypothetical protein